MKKHNIKSYLGLLNVSAVALRFGRSSSTQNIK